jgi:hypothetical protein
MRRDSQGQGGLAGRPFKRKIFRLAIKLSKAGWSWGCVATVNCDGQTIFVADAHRGDGKRFVMRADEELTAFLELQRVTRESLRFLNAE